MLGVKLKGDLILRFNVSKLNSAHSLPEDAVSHQPNFDSVEVVRTERESVFQRTQVTSIEYTSARKLKLFERTGQVPMRSVS